MKKSESISVRFFNLKFLSVAVFFVLSSLPLLAQQTQTQNSSDRQNELERESTKQAEMFWKVSSTEIAADEGNRIVAIRRVNFVFERMSAQGLNVNKKPMVEVEIFSKIKIPVTNSTQYAVIGDKVFPEPAPSGDLHTVFVYFEPKEFEGLKDHSPVSYMIIPGFLNEDYLKQVDKHGEAQEVSGAKFGRIDKTMIDRFPAIEEDEKTNSLRIARTENLPQ